MKHPTSTSRRPAAARIALVVTVVAWASSFAAMRVAVTSFSPAHVALLRFLSASIAMAVIAWRAGVYPRLRGIPPGDLARIGVVGVIGLAVYNLALAVGQTRLPAGTSSILIATAPIWMALIAVTGGRERFTTRAIAGLALGFGGVVLVKTGAGPLGGAPMAIAIVLGAAVLQACYSMLQRPLVARHGALAFLSVAVWAAAAVLALGAGGLGAELAAAPASAIAATVFLGVVPGALGYATWAYASTRVSTAEASAALYLVPPVAIVLAFVTLGEAPSAGSIAGGGLVLVAVGLLRG